MCSAYRAAGDLVRLAVVVLVVGRLAVAVHGHDVGEDGARAVVLVRVDEDAQALELVGMAKDRPWLRALLGEPHGEAVAVEVALAMDLELDGDLPVGGRQRHAREQPAVARGLVRGEADVLVGADDGVSSKVPPAALHVRVEVGRLETVCAQRNGLDVRVFTQPQTLHAGQAPRQQAQAGPWLCEQHLYCR